jgi:hypothetical protein
MKCNSLITFIGYLYRLDMPTLRLGPDITIHHQSELLPSQAASILSSISYDEFNSKLVIRGRISKLNSYRLNRVPSIKGAMMTVRFDTFGAQNNMWYNQLGSSPGGITGRIENLNIVQQTDGRNIHQELVIELSPEPALYHNNEYLHYKHSSAATIKQIDWTGSGKNGCRTHKQVNNRKDRFHETFESAVLL